MNISHAVLKELIFVAYSCRKISISKSCELLELDLLNFRKQWNEWATENARMRDIFDEFQYKQFIEERI